MRGHPQPRGAGRGGLAGSARRPRRRRSPGRTPTSSTSSSIASPTGEHVAHVLASLDAGLHVLVDKPLATTADDAELLASRGDGRLTVFQNRRWDTEQLTLLDVLASGQLGTVHRFERRWERFRPVPQDRWKENDPDSRWAPARPRRPPGRLRGPAVRARRAGVRRAARPHDAGRRRRVPRPRARRQRRREPPAGRRRRGRARAAHARARRRRRVPRDQLRGRADPVRRAGRRLRGDPPARRARARGLAGARGRTGSRCRRPPEGTSTCTARSCGGSSTVARPRSTRPTPPAPRGSSTRRCCLPPSAGWSALP